MKPLLVLLLLAAPLTLACDDAQVRASEALDRTSRAFSSLAEEVRELDLSGLSTDAIVEKTRAIGDALAERLSEISDSEEARRVAEKLEPVVDKLRLAKERVGEKMPTLEELREAARRLEQRVAGNEGLEGAVRPLIEKIESLFE